MANNQDLKSSAFKMERIGGVQCHGVLSKKAIGHKTAAWQRRFFVLKESFLLYYAEAEKKPFQDKGVFNIHPKGIIPLNHAIIEAAGKNEININYPDKTNAISLAADDEQTRKKWIQCLEVASKITSDNCALGEAMIKSLQEQGLQLAKEKQEMYEKLQRECEDADNEREQKEALEEYNHQLLEEKIEIEMLVEELQLTQTAIKRELSETMRAFNVLEADQKNMKKVNENLHDSLKELSSEREKIKKQLEETDEEKRSSVEDKAHLVQSLEELTNKMEKIEEEKSKVEERLIDNEKQMTDYKKEKKEFCENVNDLVLHIKELNEEKDDVEDLLKKEVIEKKQLEEQLKECQEALSRLEQDLLSNQQFGGTEEKNQQINNDVQSLKDFFEHFFEKTSSPAMSRRVSRRYNHIKKLRHFRPSKKTEQKPQVLHERLSSTPGIESIEEE